MIVCYINGKAAVPTLQSSIKLTRENPFVKTKDSYTYDITFPMAIPENRLVFGPLNRLDTTKRRRKFDDCVLMADNVTVIRGVGTVTSVTHQEVKLQILAGASSLRYRSGFDRVYIDRIDYPQVAAKYQVSCTRKGLLIGDYIDVDSEVRTKGYVGDLQTAVFMPVWDSSHDRMANELTIKTAYDVDWAQEENVHYRLVSRAVQPNLMLVVRTVLEYMGYTVRENAYDVAPWNELFICSARQTAIIAKALPHWTAERFLEEFRKLFNATYLFDESAKEVRIVRADSVDAGEVVAFEPVDEFNSNYDEDGLEYMGLSNIRYKLAGLSDQQLEVPDDVIQNFDIREFDSTAQMTQAFNAMTDRQKLTTLLVDPSGYLYGSEVTDGEGRKTGEIELKRFGLFTKIIRDSQSDNDIELSIVPVDFAEQKFQIRAAQGEITRAYTDLVDARASIPCVDNDELLPEEDETVDILDEEERPYVTIEDVVEAGISATAEEQEDETVMSIMWVAKACLHPYHSDYTSQLGLRLPACAVDYRMHLIMVPQSLALSHASGAGYPYIGQFHGHSLSINCGGSIDGNDEIVIQFPSDSIPDPKDVYSFHGKRYLCSKIEVNVTEYGIDRLKTGYFYEML